MFCFQSALEDVVAQQPALNTFSSDSSTASNHSTSSSSAAPFNSRPSRLLRSGSMPHAASAPVSANSTPAASTSSLHFNVNGALPTWMQPTISSTSHFAHDDNPKNKSSSSSASAAPSATHDRLYRTKLESHKIAEQQLTGPNLVAAQFGSLLRAPTAGVLASSSSSSAQSSSRPSSSSSSGGASSSSSSSSSSAAPASSRGVRRDRPATASSALPSASALQIQPSGLPPVVPSSSIPRPSTASSVSSSSSSSDSQAASGRGGPSMESLEVMFEDLVHSSSDLAVSARSNQPVPAVPADDISSASAPSFWSSYSNQPPAGSSAASNAALAEFAALPPPKPLFPSSPPPSSDIHASAAPKLLSPHGLAFSSPSRYQPPPVGEFQMSTYFPEQNAPAHAQSDSSSHSSFSSPPPASRHQGLMAGSPSSSSSRPSTSSASSQQRRFSEALIIMPVGTGSPRRGLDSIAPEMLMPMGYANGAGRSNLGSRASSNNSSRPSSRSEMVADADSNNVNDNNTSGATSGAKSRFGVDFSMTSRENELASLMSEFEQSLGQSRRR